MDYEYEDPDPNADADAEADADPAVEPVGERMDVEEAEENNDLDAVEEEDVPVTQEDAWAVIRCVPAYQRSSNVTATFCQ